MINQDRVIKIKIYQSNRFDVFEFDVGNSFESSCFVANDETNVANLAH